MAEQPTNLLSFYPGWDAYQALLIKAIAPLSSEHLALRVAPHLRPIGENVAHIISGRVSNFHLLMGEGGAQLAPLEQWDLPRTPQKCRRVGQSARVHLSDDFIRLSFALPLPTWTTCSQRCITSNRLALLVNRSSGAASNMTSTTAAKSLSLLVFPCQMILQ